MLGSCPGFPFAPTNRWVGIARSFILFACLLACLFVSPYHMDLVLKGVTHNSSAETKGPGGLSGKNHGLAAQAQTAFRGESPRAMAQVGPSATLVFCYGSNGVKQLQGRLGVGAELVGFPAVAENVALAFVGSNTSWALDDAEEVSTATLVARTQR